MTTTSSTLLRRRPVPHTQEYVYIKRTGGGALPDPDEVFAPLSIDGVASVGLLAERACAKFPRWGADAGQVRLFLVPLSLDADEPPTADEELRAVELTRPHWTLERAGVKPSSWLLARVALPAAAAGASCGAHARESTPPPRSSFSGGTCAPSYRRSRTRSLPLHPRRWRWGGSHGCRRWHR